MGGPQHWGFGVLHQAGSAGCLKKASDPNPQFIFTNYSKTIFGNFGSKWNLLFLANWLPEHHDKYWSPQALPQWSDTCHCPKTTFLRFARETLSSRCKSFEHSLAKSLIEHVQDVRLQTRHRPRHHCREHDWLENAQIVSLRVVFWD
jgi:hypothetical protein